MTAAFEPGWYVIELLGHRVRYGRVTEVTRFGESFCRIDMPTDPPTFEEYSGKALYGLRPASEESIRAYHAPRKALAASDDMDDYADAADSNDEPEIDPPDGMFDGDTDDTCDGCGKPLGDEPTIIIDDGHDDDEVWHKRCAADHAARMIDPIDGGGSP